MTSRWDPYKTGLRLVVSEAAEELRGDVRIGGATRMSKQTGVVHLRRRRRVDPEPVSEPARDQRALQPVLEREPHAEVGRQAQRPDHLRGAGLLAALGRRICHPDSIRAPVTTDKRVRRPDHRPRTDYRNPPTRDALGHGRAGFVRGQAWAWTSAEPRFGRGPGVRRRVIDGPVTPASVKSSSGVLTARIHATRHSRHRAAQTVARCSYRVKATVPAGPIPLRERPNQHAPTAVSHPSGSGRIGIRLIDPDPGAAHPQSRPPPDRPTRRPKPHRPTSGGRSAERDPAWTVIRSPPGASPQCRSPPGGDRSPATPATHARARERTDHEPNDEPATSYDARTNGGAYPAGTSR